MRCFVRIGMLCVLSAAPAVAQRDSVPAHAYPPKPATSSGLVSVQDDPQYDKTVVRLQRTALDSVLSLTALVALDGRPVRTDAPGVVLTVWSTAPRGLLASAPQLALELDGRRIELRKLWVPPQVRLPYTESGMGGMDLDQWLALANAHVAAIDIGGRRYVLSARQLEGIRDFASRMKPQAPSP